MNTEEQLRQRFKATWSAAAIADEDNADEVCRLLFDELNGPRRFYHSPEHIRNCLIEFDRVVDQLESPLVVELAIWFHDYIYHTESGEDEHESADAFAVLADSILDPELVKTVQTLIIATAHHGQLEEVDSDLGFLLDIDLSSLGADWERFMREGGYLRQERAELSDHQYYYNTTYFFNLLESLNRIYKSDFFYQAYEDRARGNLRRHRQWLEQEMPGIELP